MARQTPEQPFRNLGVQMTMNLKWQPAMQQIQQQMHYVIHRMRFLSLPLTQCITVINELLLPSIEPSLRHATITDHVLHTLDQMIANFLWHRAGGRGHIHADLVSLLTGVRTVKAITAATKITNLMARLNSTHRVRGHTARQRYETLQNKLMTSSSYSGVLNNRIASVKQQFLQPLGLTLKHKPHVEQNANCLLPHALQILDQPTQSEWFISPQHHHQCQYDQCPQGLWMADEKDVDEKEVIDVCTDASKDPQLNHKVGWSVVILCKQFHQHLASVSCSSSTSPLTLAHHHVSGCISESHQASVYVGELYAILMALLIMPLNQPLRIHIDNDAARTKAMQWNSAARLPSKLIRTEGRPLLMAIWQAMEKRHSLHVTTLLLPVRSHTGLTDAASVGNECADHLANTARQDDMKQEDNDQWFDALQQCELEYWLEGEHSGHTHGDIRKMVMQRCKDQALEGQSERTMSGEVIRECVTHENQSQLEQVVKTAHQYKHGQTLPSFLLVASCLMPTKSRLLQMQLCSDDKCVKCGEPEDLLHLWKCEALKSYNDELYVKVEHILREGGFDPSGVVKNMWQQNVLHNLTRWYDPKSAVPPHSLFTHLPMFNEVIHHHRLSGACGILPPQFAFFLSQQGVRNSGEVCAKLQQAILDSLHARVTQWRKSSPP